jgi:hypothetical protein
MKPLFFLVILLTLTEPSSLTTFYRFKSVKCSTSGKSFNILFCYVKTYSKKFFTLNLAINKSRIFEDDMLATLKIEKRGSSGQFEVKMKFEDLEWCKISNVAQSAGFLSVIVQSLQKSSFSAFILGFCEKLGEVKAENISFTDSLVLK